MGDYIEAVVLRDDPVETHSWVGVMWEDKRPVGGGGASWVKRVLEV